MDFTAAVEEFLRYCLIERRLASNTLSAYRQDLNNFSKALPGLHQVGEVSGQTLKDYLEHLTERRMSTSTMRRRFACLRSFFSYRSSHGYSPDPFLTWKPHLPRPRRLPRALSHTEAASVLNSVRDDPPECELANDIGVAVRLMMSTGMRVSEVCAIRIADISPDADAIRVHGKGSRERMVYVVDTGLKDDLKQIVGRRQKERRLELLLNRRGLGMRPQSVRMRLRASAEAAGVARRVTPHMLRHTAATALIERGVDIRFVQRLLGHSTIATTEIYTHVVDQVLKEKLEQAALLQNLSAFQ